MRINFGAVLPISLDLLLWVEVGKKVLFQTVVWVALVVFQDVKRLVQRFGSTGENCVRLNGIGSSCFYRQKGFKETKKT